MQFDGMFVCTEVCSLMEYCAYGGMLCDGMFVCTEVCSLMEYCAYGGMLCDGVLCVRRYAV